MSEERPDWLDETFLSTVLQGGEVSTPRVTVNKFTATMAVASGNNYMSHIYRVRVDYTVGESDKQSTLIVKAPITKGIVTEMSETNDFFDTEPKIYSELLPLMNKKTNINYGPKSFYCPVKNWLVLEDMKEEGYVMCDRYKQLDYTHCESAVTTLAKFHATSVACYHDNPDLIESLGVERVYVEGGPLGDELKLWLQNSLKSVGEIVAELDGCKPLADLILSKSDTILESVIELCKPKSGGFKVLNHGDFWVTNMLFKHGDSREVTDVKLIDFQVVRYATPVLDLHYFIWTSANEDVRGNRLEDLFDVYLLTLNNTLEQLGCDERLSAEEFRDDLKSALDWAIVAICSVVPFIVCETEDVINLEEMNKDDFNSNNHSEKLKKMYKGKHFSTLLPNIMKHLQAFVDS